MKNIALLIIALIMPIIHAQSMLDTLPESDSKTYCSRLSDSDTEALSCMMGLSSLLGGFMDKYSASDAIIAMEAQSSCLEEYRHIENNGRDPVRRIENCVEEVMSDRPVDLETEIREHLIRPCLLGSPLVDSFSGTDEEMVDRVLGLPGVEEALDGVGDGFTGLLGMMTEQERLSVYPVLASVCIRQVSG